MARCRCRSAVPQCTHLYKYMGRKPRRFQDLYRSADYHRRETGKESPRSFSLKVHNFSAFSCEIRERMRGTLLNRRKPMAHLVESIRLRLVVGDGAVVEIGPALVCVSAWCSVSGRIRAELCRVKATNRLSRGRTQRGYGCKTKVSDRSKPSGLIAYVEVP